MCMQGGTKFISCGHRDPSGPIGQCFEAYQRGQNEICREIYNSHYCYDTIVAGKCSDCNKIADAKGKLAEELDDLKDPQVTARRDLLRVEQAEERATREKDSNLTRNHAFDMRSGLPVMYEFTPAPTNSGK